MDQLVRGVPRPPRRDLVLPLVLGLLQLVFSPFGSWFLGEAEPEVALLTLLSTLLITTMLCWRRVAPVHVLAGVLIVLAVIRIALPPDTLVFMELADVIALFSVAVHRTAGVAAAGAALAAAVRIGTGIVVDPSLDILGPRILVDTPTYALVWALGRARRRWRARREALALQLEHAERESAAAAAAERGRLARELHDVAAHHLTSIVVQAGAAERLAASKPEMLGQALEFGAATGRATLASLRRLVAVMDTGAPGGRGASLPAVADMVAEFQRLGVPVTLSVTGERPLAEEVELAGHRIVQESLTNALRHAPGSEVTVAIGYQADEIEIVITNTGRRDAGADAVPGSGRGIGGMRERAALVGGELTAGDTGDGGWSVRAVLPATAPARTPADAVKAVASAVKAVAGAGQPPGGAGSATAPGSGPWAGRGWEPAPRLWRLGDRRILDVLLVILCVGLALSAGVFESAEGRAELFADPVIAAVLVLFAIAHATPLLARRRSPWLALAVSVGILSGWFALAATGALPPAGVGIAAMSVTVEIIAVYTVGLLGGPIYLTWLAVVLAAVPAGLAGVVIGLVEPSVEDDERLFFAVLAGVVVMVGAAAVMSIAWAVGAMIGARRRHVEEREGYALGNAEAGAAVAVQAERGRIANGLQGSVLRHTTALVNRAEADGWRPGDDPDVAKSALAQVSAEGRAALTAMRELLGMLRDEAEPEPAPRAPQPTLSGLAALTRRHSAPARPVTLTTEGEVRSVPVEVEISAFRVIERVLESTALIAPPREPDETAQPAGGEPIQVVVSYGDRDLHVTVGALPAENGARGPVPMLADVGERVDAVGGRLVVRRRDDRYDVHAWFPATGVATSLRA